MKKLISTFLLATMTATLFSGCAGGNASSSAAPSPASSTTASAAQNTAGSRKLTFMGWGNDSEVATFKALIKQYETKYPGVTVDYSVVPSADYDTKLQNMIAAHTEPDAFYISVDNLMKYAATKNLYDLSSYVENNKIFNVDNIWKHALDIYRYDGKTLESGPIYALPKDVSAFSIAYNKDLFKKAGITPPTKDKPWTWNDYREAAVKLTGNGVYGTSMYSLESAVWSNGADWLDSSLTKVAFTDPKFVEALQYVADLRSKYHAAPNSAEETSLSSFDRFTQGKLGMVGIGSWSTADLWKGCKFEWDLMDWPVSPNTGKRAVWFGSAGLAVSPTSKDKEDACNLVAFLAFNEDAQRTAYTTGMAVPTLKDMAQGEYLKMDKAPANKQAFLNVLGDYGRLATQSRTFNQEWWSEFNSGIDSVYDGKVSAKQYCASMADPVQKLLDNAIEQQKALLNQ